MEYFDQGVSKPDDDAASQLASQTWPANANPVILGRRQVHVSVCRGRHPRRLVLLLYSFLWTQMTARPTLFTLFPFLSHSSLDTRTFPFHILPLFSPLFEYNCVVTEIPFVFRSHGCKRIRFGCKYFTLIEWTSCCSVSSCELSLS